MKTAVWTSLLLALNATPAGAPIVSEQHVRCSQGDARECRLIELKKKIDFHLFDGTSKYTLVNGPRTQWSRISAVSANELQQKIDIRVAACTFYNEVWWSDAAVQEYEQLADMRVVDRAGFDKCVLGLR